MRVIECRNVCDALPRGIHLLEQWGEWQESRAGRVLVCPTPVTTAYQCPMERVLFAPGRDANPFFHLMEAMWMLAGRDDATFLDTWVRDFSDRFAEPTNGGRQHGAYGYRWRKWFGDEEPIDQLAMLIELLKKNPDDRRTVLTMWDPAADLGASKRDIPCNTQAYFRVRQGKWLDLTVLCRSNDIIWGAYGANAVHMAFLMEYIAAMAGYLPGKYYQVSNNFHVYEGILQKMQVARGQSNLDRNLYRELAVDWEPLVGDPGDFDDDLAAVLSGQALTGGRQPFLDRTVAKAMTAHRAWRSGDREEALLLARDIHAPDWRIACVEWMSRRMH